MSATEQAIRSIAAYLEALQDRKNDRACYRDAFVKGLLQITGSSEEPLLNPIYKTAEEYALKRYPVLPGSFAANMGCSLSDAGCGFLDGVRYAIADIRYAPRRANSTDAELQLTFEAWLQTRAEIISGETYAVVSDAFIAGRRSAEPSEE